MLKTLPRSSVNDIIRYQLAKSSTSVGANYEEAQGAYSKEDFKHKVGISLKEIRETNYWLRIMERTCTVDIQAELKESVELIKIFHSVMKNINFRKDVT